MKLTYRHVTHHIVRCFIDVPAKVTVRPDEHSYLIKWDCTQWNMNAASGRRSEISTTGGSAVIEWRDGGLVQVSGDLAVEISKAEAAQLRG